MEIFIKLSYLFYTTLYFIVKHGTVGGNYNRVQYIDGLVQERLNSSALAVELCLSLH